MDYFKWKELDKIEETKPFTPKQTKEEIKQETANFTLDKGVFRYGFEEEARIAVKYLEQKGYHAEMNITDNPLFVDHESYNVWFSKEELPDGYESGEWLKEELDEPEEYFVGSVAIAGTPEEAQEEFDELGYHVRVEKSAVDHFDSYYLVDIYGSKEELERLANDPVEAGLFTEDEIKSTLEEGKKKKRVIKGMGMWQWPNPEKGIEMFNHAVGADNISAGASEGTSECLHEDYILAQEILDGDITREFEIKGKYLEDLIKEMEVGSLEELVELQNGRFDDHEVDTKFILKKDELKEEAMYGLFLEVKTPEGEILKDKQQIEVGNETEINEKKAHLEEVSPTDTQGNINVYTVEFLGNSSFNNPNDFKPAKFELTEATKISLPHLDALFETEGFNAPYEWEFEGETETEESPFHFTYRVEDDQLKIYDEHEEFSIDYGEEFGYRPRDSKKDKIEKALKEDGFGDEVLEWENNVIMSIHIPSKLLKEEWDNEKDWYGKNIGIKQAELLDKSAYILANIFGVKNIEKAVTPYYGDKKIGIQTGYCNKDISYLDADKYYGYSGEQKKNRDRVINKIKEELGKEGIKLIKISSGWYGDRYEKRFWLELPNIENDIPIEQSLKVTFMPIGEMGVGTSLRYKLMDMYEREEEEKLNELLTELESKYDVKSIDADGVYFKEPTIKNEAKKIRDKISLELGRRIKEIFRESLKESYNDPYFKRIFNSWYIKDNPEMKDMINQYKKDHPEADFIDWFIYQFEPHIQNKDYWKREERKLLRQLHDRKISKFPDEELNKLKTQKDESLTESKLSWEDAIKDSYHSLVSSSGQVPTASQVLEDVADHYDLDIDVKIELDDPIKYNKWLSDVEHVLNTLGLEVLGEKLEESTPAYPEFLGYINGTLEELNPEEFINKVKAKKRNLHTNRIAKASEDEYIVYTIVCDLSGFTLESCDVYIDIIEERWTRKQGVDMDDPESYKFEETQERVLMEDCGSGEDKWDKAIQVIQEFKDSKIKKESLEEAHRDDPEVVELTSEVKDDVKRLDDLGININKEDIDSFKEESYNTNEEEVSMDKKELKEDVSEIDQDKLDKFLKALDNLPKVNIKDLPEEELKDWSI